MIIKILKLKLIVLVITGVFLISFINICGVYLIVPGPLQDVKTVIIEPKLSLQQISDKLENNSVIRYPRLFWITAKFYSLRYSLKSGEYMFTANISPLQTLGILSTGKSVIHKLVVPEGAEVSEIIAKVNSEERLFGEIKGEVPEGFLMPSTYFFSYGDQREQIIDQMRKGMSSNLDKIMQDLAPNSPLKTRIDVLTLASIVEKETKLDEERPIVAAVFLNRLKKNIKLQADPTTIYALTNGKFKLGRPLTKKDLGTVSSYNTYYVVGLPSGPIACPGIKSLEAVVKPSKTSALYFVANGKGGHNFSNDLNSHNKNVESYKKNLLSKE